MPKLSFMKASTAILVGTLVVSSCAPTAVVPPSPSSSPIPTQATATTGTATGFPQRSPNVTVTRLAKLPRDYVYVETSPGTDATLWLVDLSGASPPMPVVRWNLGSHTSSASRDGTTIVIETHGTRSVVGLAVVRPLTGEASVLYEGSADARAIYPALSPDGRRVAFALGHELSWDGVWLVDVVSGAARQLLAQPASVTNGPVYVIDWSDDGQWVTYETSDDAHPGAEPQVFIHNINDGRRIAVGAGSLASWQATEPRLLFAHVGGKGNQGAFGAAVSTYEVSRGSTMRVLSIDPRIEQLTWNPTTGRFLYLASDSGCAFGSAIWTSAPGATPWQVGRTADADAAWWSRDGTIYALARGTGATANVINAFTGQTIASLPDAVPTRACGEPTSTRTGFATICGTISDWVSDGLLTDGSLTLSSPGREQLTLTIPADRLGGGAASGYVCVGVVAGTSRPLFDGFGVSGTPLFVEQGRAPASSASPSPTGFVIPQACAYVAAPVSGVDQTDWSIECGQANDRDGRGFLGAALAGQGWTQCASGLATAQWKKNGVMLGIAESSLAPGAYPRLTQFARLVPPC